MGKVKDVAAIEAALRAGKSPEPKPTKDPCELTRKDIEKMFNESNKKLIEQLDVLKKDILENIKKELHKEFEAFEENFESLPEPGSGKPAKRDKLSKEREERANALLDKMLELEDEIKKLQEEQEQEDLLRKNRANLYNKIG